MSGVCGKKGSLCSPGCRDGALRQAGTRGAAGVWDGDDPYTLLRGKVEPEESAAERCVPPFVVFLIRRHSALPGPGMILVPGFSYFSCSRFSRLNDITSSACSGKTVGLMRPP